MIVIREAMPLMVVYAVVLFPWAIASWWLYGFFYFLAALYAFAVSYDQIEEQNQ